jgi:hypothetical protein
MYLQERPRPWRLTHSKWFLTEWVLLWNGRLLVIVIKSPDQNLALGRRHFLIYYLVAAHSLSESMHGCVLTDTSCTD